MIWFVAGALIVIALIAVLNVLMFPRLRVREDAAADVAVSVLIPARNEAAIIGQTVSSLLAQTYPRFEVIVLDDDSTDGTAEAATRQSDARLRVIRGQPLPSGWWGKNWACHQLAQAANGDLLVFTDADVQWMPGALSALVSEVKRTNAGTDANTGADLLSVWPTQRSESWSERLVVPLMAMVIIGYLPVIGVHHTPFPAFAAANGQCMAFRRQAYERVGGHAAVRGSILEDVLLARKIKAAGLRLRMADAAGLIVCRMYHDWASVRDGYAKNILAGYGGVTGLLLAAVFHWLVFLLPVVWLVTGGVDRTLAAGLVVLGIGVRMLSAAATKQRLADAVLLPVSVLVMTRIAAQALWWHWRYGGPRWKGRTITTATPTTTPTTSLVERHG